MMNTAAFSARWLARLRPFVPAPLTAPWRELLLGALGVGLGLLCTEWISHRALAGQALWFVAPMGASAVLVFSVPASPLAAAGLLAVLAMIALRCLHPPGGAVAVTAALGSPTLESLGYGYAFWPVGLNSLLMLLLALVFNRLAGRQYPHHGGAPANIHRPCPAAARALRRKTWMQPWPLDPFEPFVPFVPLAPFWPSLPRAPWQR